MSHWGPTLDHWGSWKEYFLLEHGTQAEVQGLSQPLPLGACASLTLLPTHYVTLDKTLLSLGLCFIRKSRLD